MARCFAFFTLFHLSLTFFRPEVPFNGASVFCNCSPDVQLADSRNIFTCLTLYSFFCTKYGGKELHAIYGKMLESFCMFIYSLNAQCVYV